MDIDLPSDENSSNDDSVFGGRIDLYEAYWLYVDGVRCVGPVLRQSEANKKDTDRSPLARHYNHFYEKKQSHKKKCKDLPGNLPKYKDHFQQPRGDVQKVPEDNLADLGIELDEGDDPIWLPPDYELPPVWENNLENMDKSQLQDLVRKLRSEKEDLQNERDELHLKLSQVRSSLTDYLELKEESTTQDTSSPRTCEQCGRTFESKAAKYGHSSHCEGVNNASGNVSQSDPSTNGLAELAEDLPELSDEQSAADHTAESASEELENLNHLLNGSL